MRYRVKLFCFLFYPLVVVADEYSWQLPSWMPPPPIPQDNPMTQAKVDLGRRLFFDANLSGLGYMSCSSCHMPERAFSEDRSVSIGVTGEFHTRNASAIVNSAYMTSLTWANPNETSFETQALVPLFGEHPLEMANKGYEEKVLLFLTRDPIYPALFKSAFPSQDSMSFDQITKALASFERTLISFNSPYDRYKYAQQTNAISASAKQGEFLFYSERLGCSGCHSGLHFSDATEQLSFHNTGLYNLDGKGAYPKGNQGLYEVTGKEEDKGRFRTPSLRNVAMTAPYMHDGSINTLEKVLDHYSAGGRSAIAEKRSPLVSKKIRPFKLTALEKSQLIAFLNSLTDADYLADEAHNTPFR